MRGAEVTEGRRACGHGVACRRGPKTAIVGSVPEVAVVEAVKEIRTIVEKIISGGQTGSDRAALDFAIAHGIPHAGWCPAGRKAEDGVIHSRYALDETPSANYAQRTAWNVRDSKGTAIFTIRRTLTGGAKTTAEYAAQYGRPWIHLSKAATVDPALALRDFLVRNRVTVLNVGGSRASKEPRVAAFVHDVLSLVFKAA